MNKIGDIDWKPIKTEYITTNIGQRALAKKYGISLTVLSNKSIAEGWVAERKKYADRCVSSAVRKSARREASHIERLMKATGKALDVAMEAFEDEKQFHRYIITDGIGPGMTETNEREFSKVDTKALKDLTAVIKELTGLMRDFYNLPTPSQAESQRIAAERLELDKRKADTDSTDNDIEVVLSDEIKGWAK